MLEVQLSFDYAALDSTTREAVILHRDAIRNLMRRSSQDIWDIGQHLTDVKSWLGHGLFTDWLEQEFGMKERTAQNFMSVFKTFKTANFADLNIATSALYLMASASTPNEVRDELIERAAGGETITHATAKQTIATTKHSLKVTDSIPTSASELGEGEDSSADPPDEDEQEDEPEETQATLEVGFEPAPTKLKAGDLVAGFYNPTSREEVGTLERDPGGHYSLIITAQGDRCGVVTVTLRAATEEESDLFYSAVETSEPSIDAEDESAFKKGDRVRGITANSKKVEGIVDVVGEGCIRLDSEAVIAKRTAELLERAPEVPEPKFIKGDRVTGEFSVSKELITGEVIGDLGNGSVTTVRADDGRVWGLTTESLKSADAPAPAAQTDFIASRSGSDEHYTPDWVWKPALQVIDATSSP
ncbi:MAG: DUF3102 domain-containing protein [Acaryochloridaceae cyanobacterium CSU_3_4]|nr:DUF3102 domain-containing protein [Acaryochloridaceae cyanobacterium CSU_3_4]